MEIPERGAVDVNSPVLQGLVFDLDGTLADTIPICIEAFQATFRAHNGPDLSAEEVYALFGPTEEGILVRTFGKDWEPAFATYLAEYARLHEGRPDPFPGIRDLMRRLHASGVPLALVTAKGAHSARITLNTLGITQVFAPIETGSADGSVKAASISRVLQAWNLPPRRVAYVGDAVSDVAHARRAGVVPVAVAWSSHVDGSRLLAAQPDFFFDTVDAFAAWVWTMVTT